MLNTRGHDTIDANVSSAFPLVEQRFMEKYCQYAIDLFISLLIYS